MDQWLEDFRLTVESAASRLRDISEAQSRVPKSEGHWSAKQIIGHLIDSAANNHARFVLAQIKDNLVFSGYEQERWVELQQYQNESWEELIDLWRAYNLHLVHLMSCTANEIAPSRPVISSLTSPLSVNFTALARRFVRICCRRLTSVAMVRGASSPTTIEKAIPFCLASGSKIRSVVK